MTQPMGVADFFAMEAGEYLDRLDTLCATPKAPDGEDFLKSARSLRGAAVMANQQQIAMVATGLENLAKAVREGRKPWDEATRQIAIGAIDGMRLLIRHIREWSGQDDQRARDLTGQLERASGRSTAPARAGAAGPDEGTRAFVAKEGASLAAALDQAATTLRQKPDAKEPVQTILKVMQPLRGLAVVGDLPPLPELLDGIERAVNEVARRPGAVPDAADTLTTATKALARAVREVAGAGAATVGAPELDAFAQALARTLDLDAGVVLIESLYQDGAGPNIVTQGTAPATDADGLQFVSHGEHLKQAAEALSNAGTDAQRSLRALGLAATLRVLNGLGGSPLSDASRAFARAAQHAISGGRALTDTAVLAACLRDAGGVLSDAAMDDPAVLAKRLNAVTAQVTQLQSAAPGSTSVAAPAAPPAAPRPLAPTRPMAAPPRATPVIAPAAAAPTPPPAMAPEPAPAGAPRAGEDDSGTDLGASLLRYERYARELGMGPASLDELLAGPPAVGAAPAAATNGDGAVSIKELVYSGPAALERALSLRGDLRKALAEPDGATRADDLIAEIFDLVQLGLEQH